MLIAILGKGVDKIIIALVTVQWAYYARTVRGTALVESAQGLRGGGALPGPQRMPASCCGTSCPTACRR